MGKETLTFGNIDIEKNEFYCNKTPVLSKYANIEKVLVPNKVFYGEKIYKYLISYLYDDHRVKLLYIMFPKTSAHVKIYDEHTKWMYFLVEDDD